MSKHILVIDDDPSLRALLQELLEDVAYEVDTATDGQDALEQLNRQHNPYHVILLDMNMPRMDGTQLLQVLQQRDKSLFSSIIAFSGNSVALQQALAMGISRTLSKPFDLEALLPLITEISEDEEEKVVNMGFDEVVFGELSEVIPEW